jgi:hypothetical protein
MIADQRAILSALERLDQRALGLEVIDRLRKVLSDVGQDLKSVHWGDPDAARRAVDLARALYISRIISTQEYVLYATLPVDRVHGARVTGGYYDKELAPITLAMEVIERAYGLEADDSWPIDERPEEYQELSKQYSRVINNKLLEALREFGLDDLAELSEKHPEEFERLYERGRRSVYHRDEEALAIHDIVVRFEEDARRAASVNAYSAAVTSLGAGIEGLLLLRCLRSKKKACRVVTILPKRLRPHIPEEPTTWSFETLIEVCLSAGWLPPVKTSYAVYKTGVLAHILRQMRNHVHPGKLARERPWCETDKRDYEDADAIYVVLLSILGKIGRGRERPSNEDLRV